jgi:hypothetical protein
LFREKIYSIKRERKGRGRKGKVLKLTSASQDLILWMAAKLQKCECNLQGKRENL